MSKVCLKFTTVVVGHGIILMLSANMGFVLAGPVMDIVMNPHLPPEGLTAELYHSLS
jgi:hypothetical protein